MTEIHDLTVTELTAAIRRRELSPVEITAHYLQRTEQMNTAVGAFFTITAELATDQAAQAEKAVARLDDQPALPPLTGIPIPIKDLNMMAGVRQTLVRAALNAYDAVLMPTLASPPAPVGYFEEVPPPENFERQKRFTPYTAVFNVSGQPAVSLPLYWTDGGLPIGVMLAGRMGEESTLISLSAQLESARPWRDRHPPLW